MSSGHRGSRSTFDKPTAPPGGLRQPTAGGYEFPGTTEEDPDQWQDEKRPQKAVHGPEQADRLALLASGCESPCVCPRPF